MIKSLSLAAVVCFAMFVSQSQAAQPIAGDNGNVSPELLAQMGLGQMEILSDIQGDEIRGSGGFLVYYRGSHLFHQQFHAFNKFLYFLHRYGGAFPGKHGGFSHFNNYFRSGLFSHGGVHHGHGGGHR